jgi:hypothetical protein
VAFRTFNDSSGHEWQAFDVVPRTSERRSSERRSVGAAADQDAERREADRRLTVGGTSLLSANLRSGWLVFERGAERRRLSPIPENWQHCTDGELETYLQSAQPVVQKNERRG